MAAVKRKGSVVVKARGGGHATISADEVRDVQRSAGSTEGDLLSTEEGIPDALRRKPRPIEEGDDETPTRGPQVVDSDASQVEKFRQRFGKRSR